MHRKVWLGQQSIQNRAGGSSHALYVSSLYHSFSLSLRSPSFSHLCPFLYLFFYFLSPFLPFSLFLTSSPSLFFSLSHPHKKILCFLGMPRALRSTHRRASHYRSSPTSIALGVGFSHNASHDVRCVLLLRRLINLRGRRGEGRGEKL